MRLEQEKVWLILTQMAELFGRDKLLISRHYAGVVLDLLAVKQRFDDPADQQFAGGA